MYWLCKGMDWNHLPVAGGLYDQHPKFIDDMSELIKLDNEHQAREAEERKRHQKSGKGKKR